MKDDSQLVEEYLSGDSRSIEELVVRYQRQIYYLIYRLTNDLEESKDLTQKTFLKAVRAITKFRNESCFKTWLYRIAVNTSLDQIGEQKRYPRAELNETIADSDSDVVSKLAGEERKERLRKAVHELPERQRLAVILRVYDGLSISETAHVMGCSEGAVKAHYHHAVKRLRNLLQEKSDGA
ncbi:MAG: sigma-70 family RNA polymerase sigma factor [Pseudomonadota bacterium]